jgi:hypothetical protein
MARHDHCRVVLAWRSADHALAALLCRQRGRHQPSSQPPPTQAAVHALALDRGRVAKTERTCTPCSTVFYVLALPCPTPGYGCTWRSSAGLAARTKISQHAGGKARLRWRPKPGSQRPQGDVEAAVRQQPTAPWRVRTSAWPSPAPRVRGVGGDNAAAGGPASRCACKTTTGRERGWRCRRFLSASRLCHSIGAAPGLHAALWAKMISYQGRPRTQRTVHPSRGVSVSSNQRRSEALWSTPFLVVQRAPGLRGASPLLSNFLIFLRAFGACEAVLPV